RGLQRALRRRRRDRDRAAVGHRRTPVQEGDRDSTRRHWADRRRRHGRLWTARRPEAGRSRNPRRTGGVRRRRRRGASAEARAPAPDLPLRALSDGGRDPPARLMEILAVILGFAGGVLAGLRGPGGGILFVPTPVLVLGPTRVH